MSKKKGGPPSKSLKKASDIEKLAINQYQEIQSARNIFDEQEMEAETEEDFEANRFEQKRSVPIFQQKSSQPIYQQQSKKGPSK